MLLPVREEFPRAYATSWSSSFAERKLLIFLHVSNATVTWKTSINTSPWDTAALAVRFFALQFTTRIINIK